MNPSTLRTSLAPLLAIGAIALLGSPASATNFAILLSGDGCGRDACDDDGNLRINNPLFEESEGEKHNPLYEPSTIIVTPPELTGGGEVLLSLNFGDGIEGGAPPAPGGSYVFEITLEDAATDAPITQFDKPITLGFEMPRYRGEVGDLSLGFLDESRDPPEWRVEDPTLESCRNGEVCGTTNHFTLFSVGVIPEPSSALLLSTAGALALLGRRRD